MTDQERKDLAEAYHLMMEMAAWKHFEKNSLHAVVAQSIKDEDAMPIDELNLSRIGECRGRRNGIRKVLSDVVFILEGLR